MAKTYLGDGAYAEVIDEFGTVELTTSDGAHETNRIVLKPQVRASLIDFLGLRVEKKACCLCGVVGGHKRRRHLGIPL